MVGLFEKSIYHHGALEAANSCDSIHTCYVQHDTQPNFIADGYSGNDHIYCYCHRHARDTNSYGYQRYHHSDRLTYSNRYRYTADSHTYTYTDKYCNTGHATNPICYAVNCISRPGHSNTTYLWTFTNSISVKENFHVFRSN